MAKKAAPEPSKTDPGGYGALDAKVDRIRESAKWIVGAFAAVAALLVPGLQVSDLGDLDGWRLWLALGAALVGIVAAVAAAVIAATFLRPVEPTLAELIDHEDKDDALGTYLKENRLLLRAEAKDLDQLRTEYAEARADVRKAQARAAAAASALAHARATQAKDDEIDALKETDRVAQIELKGAQARSTVLEQIIGQLQAVARLEDMREQFEERKWRIAGAALIAAAAIATFAVAAHPPSKARSDFSDARIESVDLSGSNLTQADFEDATLVDVDLRDTNLQEASFEGARLEQVDLGSADLEDADLTDTVFERTRCPDGTQTAAAPPTTCATHIYVPPDLEVTQLVPRHTAGVADGG